MFEPLRRYVTGLMGRDSVRHSTFNALLGAMLQTGAEAAPRATHSELDLVVVRANADEIAAHEALLEKLRAAGECVWDRIDAGSQAAK